MEEKFVDIKGFEGVYRIGNKGTLLSCKKHRLHPNDNDGWHPLSNVNSKGGYFSVILEHNEKKRCCRIHRLVYEHFVGEIPKGHMWNVHHINGNRQDNRVENLELLSAFEHNHKHHKYESKPSVLGAKRRKIKPKTEPKIKSPNGKWDTTYSAMNYYNQHIRPQIIIQKDLDGNFIAQYDNAAEASRATGVCARNILQVAMKTPTEKGYLRKTAGGYKWEAQSRS
jgi:hypothetical protein